MVLDALAFDLDAESELDFRREHLAADVARVRAVLLLVGIGLVPLACNDRALLGSGAAFAALSVVRLALVTWTLWLWRHLATVGDPRRLDRVALAWSLAILAFGLAVAATRPASFVGHAAVAMACIFVALLAMPTRFDQQLVVAAGWAAGEIGVLLWAGTARPVVTSVSLSIAAVTLAAALSGWQLQLHRRREHVARRALRRAHDELEEAVELRTAELRHATEQLRRELTERAREVTERRRVEHQLRQSQKLEAVGRLAGGVAHDFNNVLTAILSASQELLDGLPEGAPLREPATEIRDAGRRASALTRQLLVFSRQQSVEPRVIDLNELVSAMARLLARLVGEDVELATSLEPEAGCVRADPGQLEQVVVNLAVNARDAMPSGGRLAVSTRGETLGPEDASLLGLPPGPYVSLAVSDTGCGMAPEVQSHLFEPFFTTKGVGKGTGLGLATVYGIVARAGGRVTVTSEPGRGTRVQILLPAADGVPTASEERRGAPARGRETILLVEDEPMVRRHLVRVLRGAGYTLLEAADGEEALRVAAASPTPVDLLVTDVVMPRMGGPELARRLQGVRPEARVLLISGYAKPGAVDHGMELLQKPFEPHEVASRIRAVLDRPGR